METLTPRLEDRSSLHVTVDLCSLDVRQRPDAAITENVSSHGARVVSSKPWKPNMRLDVRSRPGNLRARARVVYCEPMGTEYFAIGLQLLASAGQWE